jgi:hypothetical protein
MLRDSATSRLSLLRATSARGAIGLAACAAEITDAQRFRHLAALARQYLREPAHAAPRTFRSFARFQPAAQSVWVHEAIPTFVRQTERILINVKDVEYVEFLPTSEDGEAADFEKRVLQAIDRADVGEQLRDS